MKRPGGLAAVCLLFMGMGPKSPPPIPAPVASWLADAKSTAWARYQLALHLDGRDADVLGSIVRRVHQEHRRRPMPPEAVRGEARRWGAVCSELVRGMYSESRWQPAKDRNRDYGFSVLVPFEGGHWNEDDCFDLIEGLIGSPRPQGALTIEQVLALHFLD